MNATASAIDFAHQHHRRQRSDQQPRPQVIERTPPEVSPDLGRNAALVADGIEKLQTAERTAREENNDLRARLRQADIKIDEQRTTIESLTTELSAEKGERIRLAAGVEQIAHAVTNLAARPTED